MKQQFQDTRHQEIKDSGPQETEKKWGEPFDGPSLPPWESFQLQFR